jgi:hypothetical protein
VILAPINVRSASDTSAVENMGGLDPFEFTIVAKGEIERAIQRSESQLGGTRVVDSMLASSIPLVPHRNLHFMIPIPPLSGNSLTQKGTRDPQCERVTLSRPCPAL